MSRKSQLGVFIATVLLICFGLIAEALIESGRFAWLTQAKRLPFLPVGNSSKTEIGDHVAVIGSPVGLEGSLSEGIISAKRELPDRKRPLPTPVLSQEHYPPPRNFEFPFDKTNWLQ